MLRYSKQNYKSKRNYDSVAGLQTRGIVTNRETETLIWFLLILRNIWIFVDLINKTSDYSTKI